MNWTLLVVGVILVISAIVGCKRGLVKSLFSMLALAVILIGTSILAPKLAPVIREHTDWDEKVYESTATFLEEQGLLLHDLNTGVDEALLDSLWIPYSLKQELKEHADETLTAGMEAYNAFLTEKIANALFTVFTYVGVLILVTILVIVAYAIINAASKLPGIREANHFGGLLLGLLSGLLFVELGMMIITIFSQSAWAQPIGAEISRNIFLRFLYDRNPFMMILVHLIR